MLKSETFQTLCECGRESQCARNLNKDNKSGEEQREHEGLGRVVRRVVATNLSANQSFAYFLLYLLVIYVNVDILVLYLIVHTSAICDYTGAICECTSSICEGTSARLSHL